uniref:MULE transposase domain-containing protein n=1 Tax=Lactuca sativa TaxID=4236 RepID=A0A9R1XQP9_LACSA|nr:hypothetical protein LSAT_V11C200056370 [Lactuca sativa]
MLPVIFLGNVRIRGEYLNSMFVAVAVDGNNNTTPIAFGIGVESNVNSCTWFLMRLKDAIGEGREVAFITDMDDTICSYVDQVFPDAYHGYSSKSVLISCLLRIGHRKKLDYFHAAHEVLANIINKKWARAYSPNIRWNVLNINILEFPLVLSVSQHNVPIILLIYKIVQYIQQTFAERSVIGGLLSTVFTPYAEMVLHKNMQKSLGWKATKIPTEIPSPFPSNIFRVFLSKKNILVIACCQAIVVARYTNNKELIDMTRNVNVVPPASEWLTEPLMVVLIPK